MSDIVNVINLPRRTERLKSFIRQSDEQGFDYRVWEGIIDLAATFRGISHAHRNIIINAKQMGLERCCVCEDDILFTAPNSWQYFLDNIPDSYDMYFASIYEGKIDENNRLVKGVGANELLSGLTLYVVHSRFYDVFINIYDLDHRDKQIGMLADKYEFYVCPEFCAIQSNGYSDQKKKDCTYDHLLVGRKLFGVNENPIFKENVNKITHIDGVEITKDFIEGILNS